MNAAAIVLRQSLCRREMAMFGALITIACLGCSDVASDPSTSTSDLDRSDLQEVAVWVASRLYSHRMTAVAELVPAGKQREEFQRLVALSGGGVMSGSRLSV